MSIATEYDAAEFLPVKESAYRFARRMINYYSDPSTVETATINSYGFAPPRVTIERWMKERKTGFTWNGKYAEPAEDEAADDYAPKPTREIALEAKQSARQQRTMRDLQQLVRRPVAELPAEKVVRVVGEVFGMTPAKLKSADRHKALIFARAVVLKVLREQRWETGGFRYSLPHLARIVGRGDHSTVINALDKFDIYAKRDARVMQAYHAAKDALRTADNAG